MKGELRHPTRDRLRGGFRHLERIFLHMDDNVEWIELSGAASSTNSSGYTM